jgi:putative ABC transport system ATP-binding protein
MSLFSASNLCRSFHLGQPGETRAVENVSLSIAAGEIAVLAGPSGSGKTTLLSLLGLLDRPTSGRLAFQDRDLTHGSDMALARARRLIGFVFQDSSLLPKLSLIDNIGYPLIPRGVSRADRRKTAERWLARLGLGRHAKKHPGELSAGERQRAALARALAGEPLALLADEPTSNLDQATSREVLDVLREANARGVTLVAATHDPAIVAMASQVLTLYEGKLTSEVVEPIQ